MTGDGNSPVKIKCTAVPKETRPISSTMSYPRTATRLGSMRVTAVFQTAFLSVSLIRLCPFIFFKISTTASGSSPNASTTVAPASRNAFTLPACVPRPPSMIAPAWLNRVPSRAAFPPIYAITGLVTFRSRISCASSSSWDEPISPKITIASVNGSASNISAASGIRIPSTASPPMCAIVEMRTPACPK